MQKKQQRHWVKKWNCTFRSKKETLIPWILLAPSLTGVSVFILIPFADVVRRSFLNAVGSEFVGVKNYKSVLDNTAFQTAAFKGRKEKRDFKKWISPADGSSRRFCRTVLAAVF